MLYQGKNYYVNFTNEVRRSGKANQPEGHTISKRRIQDSWIRPNATSLIFLIIVSYLLLLLYLIDSLYYYQNIFFYSYWGKEE